MLAETRLEILEFLRQLHRWSVQFPDLAEKVEEIDRAFFSLQSGGVAGTIKILNETVEANRHHIEACADREYDDDEHRKLAEEDLKLIEVENRLIADWLPELLKEAN